MPNPLMVHKLGQSRNCLNQRPFRIIIENQFNFKGRFIFCFYNPKDTHSVNFNAWKLQTIFSNLIILNHILSLIQKRTLLITINIEAFIQFIQFLELGECCYICTNINSVICVKFQEK